VVSFWGPGQVGTKVSISVGQKSNNIITGQISRSIHSTINSKRDLDGYDTTPFGYKRQKKYNT